MATGVSVPITVEGHDLPGRSCAPDDAGHGYTDVHVGICDRSWKGSPVVQPHVPWGVVGVVAGDAPSVRWDVDVRVKEIDLGLDFGGSFVRGRRGDRNLALAWGELHGDDRFDLFRVAKLKLEPIDPTIVRRAMEPGNRLVARVRLTDAKGNPRCATVKAPDLVWSVEPA